MQPETEVWRQKYLQAREHLRHYYKYTNREGFRFAFNDCPPFISSSAANGGRKLLTPLRSLFGGNGAAPRGPFYELMKEVADDLETQVKPLNIEWSSFAEGLARREFATVAAPIMPIHNRTFQIVNLIELRCGALFFSKDLGRQATSSIRDRTHNIYLNLQYLRTGSRGRDECVAVIDSELRGIAEIGKGFAVGKFYFEQYLLQYMNGAISLELPGRSLVDEAQTAANDQHLCLIDFTTLRTIEDKLGRDGFSLRYDFVPLFGDPIPYPAGLPFMNDDVGIYLWYRWRHEEPNRFEHALESLTGNRNGHLTPESYRLIDRTSLPVGMEYPGILTTRNISFYEGISSLVYESHLGADPAEQLKLSNVINSQLPPTPDRRALPEYHDEIGNLRDVIEELEQKSGGRTARGLRATMQEESAAWKYVSTRYQSLVNRKYLEGLSPSELDELNALEATLDEMDEPYYEVIIKRLRKLIEHGET